MATFPVQPRLRPSAPLSLVPSSLTCGKEPIEALALARGRLTVRNYWQEAMPEFNASDDCEVMKRTDLAFVEAFRRLGIEGETW